MLMPGPWVKLPVAVNCCVEPRLMLGFAGVTAIETRVAFVTVRFALSLKPWNAAAIVVVPIETPVATPSLLGTLLIVATEGADDVHLTTEVRSSVLLSRNTPVAVNGSWIVSGT